MDCAPDGVPRAPSFCVGTSQVGGRPSPIWSTVHGSPGVERSGLTEPGRLFDGPQSGA